MHVGLFCNEFPPRLHGGIGTFVETYARGLKAAGHEPVVVELGEQSGERMTADGVRVVTLQKSNAPRPVAWYLNRRALRGFIRREAKRKRLDIFEVPEFQGWLPEKVDECPVAVRLHLSLKTIAQQPGAALPETVTPMLLRVMGWCEGQTLRKHRNWIAVSNHALSLTRESFPGIRPNRQRVILYPIVPPAAPVEIEGEVPQRFVLYAGRVTSRKGAVRLAEAARLLMAESPDLHLVYAGGVTVEDGVPLDRRIGQILGPGLSPRCRFLGVIPRAQVVEWMKRASVFALPSRMETFGLVVAEAMLAGCPVVTPQAPPFTEFVTHGRTGLLVPTGEGESAQLTASLRSVLEDRDLAARLGAAGKAAIEAGFSLEDTVSQSVQFYKECLASQRRTDGER